MCVCVCVCRIVYGLFQFNSPVIVSCCLVFIAFRSLCSARNVAPAPRVNQEYDSLRNQTLLHAQGIHLNTKELIRHIQTVKVHI